MNQRLCSKLEKTLQDRLIEEALRLREEAEENF